MNYSDDSSFDNLANQLLESVNQQQDQEMESGELEFYDNNNYSNSQRFNNDSFSNNNNRVQDQLYNDYTQQQQHQQEQIYFEPQLSSEVYDEDIEFEFQEFEEFKNQDQVDQGYQYQSYSPPPQMIQQQPQGQSRFRHVEPEISNQVQSQQSQIMNSNARPILPIQNQPPQQQQQQQLPIISQQNQNQTRAHPQFQPLRPIARPAPISNPNYQAPLQQQRQVPQKHSFPIPANGNVNRRRDEQLRPENGNSLFQPSLGGSYTNTTNSNQNQGRANLDRTHSNQNQNSTAEISRRNSNQRIIRQKSSEEDYFGDEDGDFEKAMVSIESSVPTQPSRASNQLQSNIPSRQASFERERKAKSTNPNGGIKLRPVSSLPDMFRSLFKFGVFNAIQSTSFDRYVFIYNTNGNVVVSAPTGAGKTVLFELAMLRLFSTSNISDSKVVYVAPTRSLCNERAQDWKMKFGRLGLGWEVVELTGDSAGGNSTLRDVGSARVIVTTPEKWDSMTRKWYSHEKVLAKIRLLCIDECHFVGMDVRGAVLEVIVSRFKTLAPSTRFIAVSATVPNIEDVAEWLGAGNTSNDIDEVEVTNIESKEPATIFNFGEEFRPCKLNKMVVAFPNKGNDFAFASTLDYKLMDLIKAHASGKAVLIFCNTRKSCSKTADTLQKEYTELSLKRKETLPWPKPSRGAIKADDKVLASYMENGVAFHNAGLSNHDRQLVEKSFLDGSISIVCSTSTLSVGVNLPARMVIIKGTKQYQDGTFVEYSDLEMIQMMGRAGRPQFDTLGVAVIMTDTSLQKKYEALANSQTMLESCLHKNLIEHVNSEITLRTIDSVDSALEWLRSTFLFIRINKRPNYYALDNSTTAPKDRLEEMVVEAVKKLVETGVVEEGADSLGPTELGNMMARFYLSHSTFTALQSLPMKSNMRTILECLASCSEFATLRFRQGEKKLFTDINKLLKYPAQKVVTTADKVMILIGIILQGIPLADIKIDNANPSADVMMIWKHASRILKCMADLALERRDGGARTIYELLRSINAKAWEGTPFILRQLDGIGEKGIKALSERDIFTFQDVYSSESSRLELILNRNPPFGRKLIAQARSFPEFSITLTAESEEVVESGIKITLEVEAGLTVTNPPPTLKKGRDRFWASLLIYTSDGEYIEFRRIKVDKFLESTRDFRVSVVLVKPSQKIIASIACDDLAGSEVKCTYKPTSLASDYPLPSIEQRKNSIQDVIEEDDVEDESKVNQSKSLAPIFSKSKKIVDKPAVTPKTNSSKSKGSSASATIVQESSEPEEEAIVLPNGNLACNHSCKDKTACRHMCCREGIPQNKRKRSKVPKIKDDEISDSTPLTFKKVAKSSITKTKEKHLDPLETLSLPKNRPKARRLSGPSKSSGVVLSKGEGYGKKTTATTNTNYDSSEDEEDDLPTIEEAMSFSRKKESVTTTKPAHSINSIFKKSSNSSIKLPPNFDIKDIDAYLDDSDASQDNNEEEQEDEEIDQLLSPTPSPTPPLPLSRLNSLKRTASTSLPQRKRSKVSKTTTTLPLFRYKSKSPSPSFSEVIEEEEEVVGGNEGRIVEEKEDEVDELDESQEVMQVEKLEEENKEEEEKKEVIEKEEEEENDEDDFDDWLANVIVV